MAEDYMLTTIDNEWNPFTHFSEWYERDRALGYNTLGLLASFALSDYENDENDEKETDKAIATICNDPFLGSFYIKVTKDGFEKLKKERKKQLETEKDKNRRISDENA